MRRNEKKRILSRLTSLMLVLSMLFGTGALSAFAQEPEPGDGSVYTDPAPETPAPDQTVPDEPDPQEDESQTPDAPATTQPDETTEPANQAPAAADVLLGAAYALVSPGDTQYYVDAADGNDDNDGTTEATAWKSLDRVNAMRFAPGDKILFKAGGVWNGMLAPAGSGVDGRPIVIDRYGDPADPKPAIHGGGTSGPAITGAVMLYNVEYWEVYNLEVTNLEPTNDMGGDMNKGTAERAGILAFSSIQDRVLKHIVIKDCYVHDVNSNFDGGKTSGGIIIMGHYMDKDGNVVTIDDNGNRTNKAMGRAAYEDVLIEGNYVKNVAVEGIRNKCNTNIGSTGWGKNEFLKNYRNVTIRDNYIEQVVGDGIVLTECVGGLVEGNVVNRSCNFERGATNYAQCWTMFADDIVVQYNEVYGNRYGYDDGEAFDSDMMNRDNVFQYNLSHDNGGGACLFMSSQSNTTFRYNVSINDGAGTTYNNGTKMRQQVFHYDSTSSNGANVPQIYNNTIYVNGADHSTVLFGGKSARTCFINFKNNIVLAENGATVTFGHSDSTTHSGSIIENNCFYPASIADDSGKTAAQLAAANNIFADPMLKDPTAGLNYSSYVLDVADMDAVYGLAKSRVLSLSEPYQLQDGSPCIRAGASIPGAPETDLFGNSIAGLTDIGAHEYSDRPETPSQIGAATAVTPVGVQPELPETLEVTIEGKQYEFAVTWAPLTETQLNTVGQYEVEGSFPGLAGVKAQATVYVVDQADSFEAVSVTTWIGYYPALPATVTANFSTGGGFQLEVPVVWDIIPNDELAQAGNVGVTGRVTGLPGNQMVMADIEVQPASAQITEKDAAWDTHMQNDNAGPFNTSNQIQVKGSPDSKYGRRGLIDFDLSANADAIRNASRITLKLEVTYLEVKSGSAAGQGVNTERYLRVYDMGEHNTYAETLKWNDMFSGLNPVPNAPLAVDDTLFINKDLNDTTSVIELDVTDYVKSSGKTSFQFLICVLKQGATHVSNCAIYFASNEHATRNGPKLAFEYNPVTSVEAVTASTPAKEYPVLPETVQVTYQDSNTATKAVTWNAVPASDYAAQGNTFTVQGTVAGVSRPAVATVTVTEALPYIVSVQSFEPIEKPTGTPESGLGLPTQAEVTLSTGGTATVPVSYWFPEPAYDPTQARDYTWVGYFNLNGLDIRNYDNIQASIHTTLVRVPDKNILTFALLKAQAAAQDGTMDALVPSVRSQFDSAVLAANAVYEDMEATVPQIQDAYKTLQAAVWKLSYVRADKNELQAAIDRGVVVNLAGYSQETTGALNAALDAARALMANDELSVGDQPAIDAAAKAIDDAIAALKGDDGGSGGSGGTISGGGGGSTGDYKGSISDIFNDIPYNAWYERGVQFCINAGIMEGDGQGNFLPMANTSRAMLMTILYRIAGEPKQDAADASWYGPARAWAMATGLSDGSDPNGTVTREQVAAMLYRYAKPGAVKGGLESFADAASVSAWAREAMAWAVQEGILTGKTGNRLDPQGTATRAEVATLIQRFAEKG